MTQRTTKITYRKMTEIVGRVCAGLPEESGVVDAGPDVNVTFDVVSRDLRLKGPRVSLVIPWVSSFRIEHVEIQAPLG